VGKKIKKSIKSRKLEKKITEKSNREKKPIKILKKPTGSVWFYKPETKKTEPIPNRKNEAKPVFVQKTRTEPKPVDLNRFWFFSFLNFNLIIFFNKN
jgi:hypothetical protein